MSLFYLLIFFLYCLHILSYNSNKSGDGYIIQFGKGSASQLARDGPKHRIPTMNSYQLSTHSHLLFSVFRSLVYVFSCLCFISEPTSDGKYILQYTRTWNQCCQTLGKRKSGINLLFLCNVFSKSLLNSLFLPSFFYYASFIPSLRSALSLFTERTKKHYEISPKLNPGRWHRRIPYQTVLKASKGFREFSSILFPNLPQVI